MRVLNNREEKTKSYDVGVFSILAYAIFCALGFSSPLFAPLPMILAYARLGEDWSKLAILLGAVFSIAAPLPFPPAPLPLVAVGFAFGLFIADGVFRNISYPRAFAGSVVLGLAVSFGALAYSAYMDQISLSASWLQAVNWTIERSLNFASESPFSHLEDSLKLWQGPFWLATIFINSFWLSVAAAAHFGWVNPESDYTAAKLKEKRATLPLLGVFALLMALNPFVEGIAGHLVRGFLAMTVSFLFIYGSAAMARLLNRRKLPKILRSFIYGLCIIPFGVVALIVLGLASPFVLRKSNPVLNKETV